MYVTKSDVQSTTFDLCIVGSGPAGMILALELGKLKPDWKALLIDYGDRQSRRPNELDDSILLSDATNHHGPYECTNKGLGGSSMTWGGRCVMYDRIDFMDRPVLGGQCTWDESLFDDIQQYVGAAADYFKCGDPDFDLEASSVAEKSPIAEGVRCGPFTDTRLERWSLPTRFGKEYGRDLQASASIRVLLNTLCERVAEPSETGDVATVAVRDVESSQRYSIRARRFVLAPGAQEATRLLLKSHGLFKRLPRPPDALGKYYQSHVSGKIASVAFRGDPRKTNFGFLVDRDGVFLRRRFQMTDGTLLESNLLNTALWLDNPLYHDPAHGSGPMSLIYLAMISPIIGKRLLPPAIANSITKGKRYGLGGHLRNVILQLPHALAIPASIFIKRYVPRRKLPGVFLYSKSNEYALHFHAEQLPLERNRMVYDSERDALRIDYMVADEDAESVVRAHERLDDWLRATGAGELRYWYPKPELAQRVKEGSRDGLHQNGTTRIADSPGRGVVDKSLRVFGTRNLYVCSSSAFPTSGQANPTFLLGVFAVRLARHLASHELR